MISKPSNTNLPPAGPGLFTAAVALLIFFMVWLFSSCHPQARMAKLMDKHPGIAAVECEDRFPVVEYSDTVTVQDSALLQAYEEEFAYLAHLLDSVIAKGCDSTVIEKIATIYREKPCPPAPVKVVTVTKESTAKLEILRDSTRKAIGLQKMANDRLGKELAQAEKEARKQAEIAAKAKRQRNWLIWVVVCFALWTFRRQILRVVRPL